MLITVAAFGLWQERKRKKERRKTQNKQKNKEKKKKGEKMAEKSLAHRPTGGFGSDDEAVPDIDPSDVKK